MTRLSVRLHQPLAEGYVEAGAVAVVRRVADVDGKPTRVWWSEQRPIAVVGGDGATGPTTSFTLPSGGVYSVEVTRPRGAELSRELEIAEGEDRSETITLEASPHEYLGWQQYAGIVRSDPYRRQSVLGTTAAPATGSDRLDGLLVLGQRRIDDLYSKVAGPPSMSAAAILDDDGAWRQVADATRGGTRDWADASGPLDWPPSWDDEYVTWFRDMPTPSEGIELIRHLKRDVPVEAALLARFPRWIAVDAGERVDLASVPWAWWGARRDQGEQIRLLYDRVRPSPVERERPGRFTLGVQDRRWFGMLEFLASGRLSLAGGIFEHAIAGEEADALFDPEVALYGKVKGPLVATAGAIVLVAGATSNEPQPWDRWLDNLSRWFPGIPDGAILLGCRRAAQATDHAGLEEAHRLLRLGIHRGLPFFSATFRLLTVTLAQIGGDVPDADDDRRFVAPVVARVDPDQPFTVIRL